MNRLKDYFLTLPGGQHIITVTDERHPSGEGYFAVLRILDCTDDAEGGMIVRLAKEDILERMAELTGGEPVDPGHLDGGAEDGVAVILLGVMTSPVEAREGAEFLGEYAATLARSGFMHPILN